MVFHYEVSRILAGIFLVFGNSIEERKEFVQTPLLIPLC